MSPPQTPVSPTGDEHLSIAARGGALNLAGSVVAAVGMIGLVLVLARQVDATLAGEFFAVTSTVLVLTALSSLGTDAGLGRFLLRFEILSRSGHIQDVLRSTVAGVLLVSSALGLLLFALSEQVVDLIGISRADGVPALHVLAVATPVIALSDLSFAATRAFSNMTPTVVWDRIIRSVLQLGAVLVVTFRSESLADLVLAWAVPYAVSLLGGAVLLRRTMRRRSVPWQWRRSGDAGMVGREFWSFTWARGMAQVAQLVIQRADIVIIAAILSPRDAAIYTAATRFVPLGQLVVQSTQQVLQPRFTVAIAHDDMSSLRSLFRAGTCWSMLIAWPVYCVTAAAPGLYLGLFGSEYGGEGVGVVLIMASAMLLGVASGPLDTVIVMLGRSGISLFNTLVALVVDIGLCFVLIPVAGVEGAAWAWFASRLALSALGLSQVVGMAGVTPFSRATALAGVLSVVFVGGPPAVGTLVGASWPVMLALCVVAALLYLVMVWLTRDKLLLTGFTLRASKM